jgi:hypothetical protein
MQCAIASYLVAPRDLSNIRGTKQQDGWISRQLLHIYAATMLMHVIYI